MRTRAQVGLVVCLLALPSCMDLRARAYAGYMQSELSGDLGLAPSFAPAAVSTSVDVEDSFGVSDEGSPYVRLEAAAGPLNFTASAFRYDSDSTGTLQANFGDITAGLLVNTETEFFNAKGAVTFDILDVGFLRLSPGLAVDYFDIDVSVTAVGLGAQENLDVQAPVPMLFAQAEATVGPVAATVDVGGIAIDVGDVDGTYFDVEALLRVAPVSHIEVFAGYRWINMDGKGTADGQDFDADLTLQGWFLGGGFTF